MKKNILKYSSLLALLGSSFFIPQIMAAECIDGANSSGCSISTDSNNLLLTGNITTTDYGIYIQESNSNRTSYKGNIATTTNNAIPLYIYSVRKILPPQPEIFLQLEILLMV